MSLIRWSWKHGGTRTSNLTPGISTSMMRTLRRNIRRWTLCFSMTHQSMQKIPISHTFQNLRLKSNKQTLLLLLLILQQFLHNQTNKTSLLLSLIPIILLYHLTKLLSTLAIRIIVIRLPTLHKVMLILLTPLLLKFDILPAK